MAVAGTCYSADGQDVDPVAAGILKDTADIARIAAELGDIAVGRRLAGTVVVAPCSFESRKVKPVDSDHRPCQSYRLP